MKNCYSLFLALLLLAGANLYATENVYFTGAVSDRWEDPANWVVGDSIDATDGIQGLWIDSLSLWIKTFDPALPQVWFTGSDGVTQYSFDVNMIVKASAGIAMADSASHLIYNNLTAPAWTRPRHITIETGAEMVVSHIDYAGPGNEIFYINKDLYMDGKLTIKDTTFMGSRNQVFVGANADAELFIESGSELNVKVITNMGGHSVQVDTVDNVPVETITDHIGKIYVRGGSMWPGGNYGLSWGNPADIPGRANGSCVIIDSGWVQTIIRDFEAFVGAAEEPLANPLIIINGGEFRSLDNYDLLIYAEEEAALNIFAAGDGRELVYTQADGYVSITATIVNAVKQVAELEVKMYPNPSKGGNFTIDVPSAGLYGVSIYNVAGQSVFTRDYQAVNKINVNARLSRGVYFIKMNSGLKANTQKLIVD